MRLLSSSILVLGFMALNGCKSADQAPEDPTFFSNLAQQAAKNKKPPVTKTNMSMKPPAPGEKATMPGKG